MSQYVTWLPIQSTGCWAGINRGNEPGVREAMVLHPPPAGTHLDTWVPLSKSPIVKPEWVLKKVTEAGRFQRTCQIGNRKKKEILILKQRRAGAIKGFKSPEGCREEKGDAGSVGLLGPRDGVGEAQNQEEAHSAQFRKLPCSKQPSPLALGPLPGSVHLAIETPSRGPAK